MLQDHTRMRMTHFLRATLKHPRQFLPRRTTRCAVAAAAAPVPRWQRRALCRSAAGTSARRRAVPPLVYHPDYTIPYSPGLRELAASGMALYQLAILQSLDWRQFSPTQILRISQRFKIAFARSRSLTHNLCQPTTASVICEYSFNSWRLTVYL